VTTVVNEERLARAKQAAVGLDASFVFGIAIRGADRQMETYRALKSQAEDLGGWATPGGANLMMRASDARRAAYSTTHPFRAEFRFRAHVIREEAAEERIHLVRGDE
jgi:hypothetical protein